MELSERLKNLSPAKRALLLKALREDSGESADVQTIPRRRPDVTPPLSFAQQRLWFLDQLQPGSAFYNMPMAVRLSGWLDVAALEKSVNEIIRRHEALRTTFRMTESGPVQVINPAMPVTVTVIEMSNSNGDGAETQRRHLEQLINDESRRGFDLTRGPLMRGSLIRVGENDHIVLLTMHHIAGDGWSFGVFLREITALYAAFSADQPSPLRDPTIQYADFTLWQRDWLQGDRLQAQLDYWKEQLAGLEHLQLPVDKVRPETPTDRGTVVTSNVPRELSAGLQELSRRHGCTLFMTLLAAFQTLLFRYTGQDNISVGTPTANRTQPELESLIGFFANTLVLRTDLAGDPTFVELLGRVRPIVLGAFAHQDIPFEMVVEALQPERALGHNPLFRVAFALQNAPLPPVELPGLKQVPLDVETTTTRFDLTLALAENANGLGVSWEYSSDIFEHDSIVRMAQNFKTLLRNIVMRPETRISRLSLLTTLSRREKPTVTTAAVTHPFEVIDTISGKALVLHKGDEKVDGGAGPSSPFVTVRDEHLQIVPDGVWGEVCIGAAAIPPGFSTDPESAKDRFGKDPVSAETLYRTGDRGRRRVDGRIELARHNARYARVGQFQIDLNEVVATLLKDPSVTDCAVRSRSSEAGETWLLAYIVCAAAASPDELRALLRSVFPDHVVATTGIVQVAAIPLTTSGLVDEAALQRMEVIDAGLIAKWEDRVRSVPGIEDVVVLERDVIPVLPPLHITDLLPAGVISTESGAGIVAQRTSLPVQQLPPEGAPSAAAVSHGEPVLLARAPQSLQDTLRNAAMLADAGLVCIQADGSEMSWTYRELVQHAERVLRGLGEIGLHAGDKVILQFGKNQEFIAAFWGCVLGGFVPVPAPLPSSYQEANGSLGRLQSSWEMLDRPLVLTDSRRAPEIRSWAARAGLAMWVTSSGDFRDNDALCKWHESQPEDVALILLTSGSTGLPKGVQLTHRNLITRSAASRQLNRFSAAEVTLNWLPLDHVGGIVYFHLRDVFLGCRQVHAPTDRFLEDPLRWLEWIERHRATISWAPNFAFGLVNDRVVEAGTRRWDLSSMRFISNGGEAVVARTARRFLQLLAPHGLRPDVMHPAWGMSETSSGVTYSYNFLLDSTSDEDGFVELGAPIPSVSMRIVDEAGALLRMGETGRLQISGATITPGYYGKPQLNEDAFTADGWFKTGDLGFLRDGRLTITGREKDVIIIGGRNLSSQEIETVVEEIDGVDTSFTAACAVHRPGSTDQLAIFFCCSQADMTRQLELIEKIREQVVRNLSIRPDYLIPLKQEDIPKTSIGKIQYSQLRDRFERGDYDAILKQLDIESGNANTVPDWFFKRSWHRSQASQRDALLMTAPAMVFLDSSGLGAELCDSSSVRVEAASSFVRVGPNHYRIDPRDPDHYTRLLQSLSADGVQANRILHLWTYEKYAGPVMSREALNRAQDRGLYSLLFLVQALARRHDANDSATLKLLVVSNHTQTASTSDKTSAEKSPILGLIRTVPQEMPWLDCRHVDLDEATIADNAAIVRREWTVIEGDREIAYRGGRRLVPRLEKLELAKGAKDLPFETGDMVLITGGLGGIGVEVAKYLLRRHQAHVLLIGRTALPERNTWPSHLAKGDGLARRIESFIALERLSGNIAYAAVDVGDLAGLRETVEKWKTEWHRPLRGVIHLAGIFQERLLADETKASFSAALHPKVLGAWALDQLLRDDPRSIFICFSSVNAIFGGTMAGSYAAANSFLDSFVRSSSANPLRYCFHWSMWDGVGMSREYAQKNLSRAKGYHAITTSQGMHSFLAGLCHRQSNLLVGLDGGNRNIRRLVRKGTGLATELIACCAAADDAAFSALDGLSIYDHFGVRSRCSFVRIEKMPRTETGEIDRSQLDALIGSRRRSAVQRVLPRTEVERQIAQIWEEVLRVPNIGVHDNFFELGGDSILAIQAISKANQIGLRFIPAQLFQHQTIAGLATVVQLDGGLAVDQGPVVGPTPLTPIQQWFFDQDLPELHHFNMSLMLKVSGELDLALLPAAVERIVLHHDALRLRYERDASGWRQWYAGPEESRIEDIFSTTDFSGLPEGEQAVAVETTATQLQASLDLSRGPIIRVAHLNLGAGRPGRLLFVIHHLVMDGLSWRILLPDLFTVYEQLSRGVAVMLPPKTNSFQTWAAGLAAYAQSEAARRSLEYWRALAERPVAALPAERPDADNTIAQLRFVSAALNEEETRALLQDVPGTYHTQINDVLLTALAMAFERWTGQRTLYLDLEGHGREDILEGVDVSRTVGWFTSMFPVRLDPGSSSNPGDALKSIKEQIRQIPERGIGYGILRYLCDEESIRQALRAVPQPELSFNYMGQVNQAAPENAPLGVEEAPESIGPSFSPAGRRRHLIDVVGIVVGGRLQLDWAFSGAVFDKATMERLAQSYVDALREIIVHCKSPDAGGYTPSDFPLAGLDDGALAQVLTQVEFERD